MNQHKGTTDFLTKHQKYLGLGILLFAILLYANTLKHEYVLDDHSIITNHSHVQAGTAGIGTILSTNYRNGQQGFNDGLYRPLSLVTFALEEELFNGNPIVSHGINTLLYALACLLLFLALKRLFADYPLVIPLSICLIFISHPLHTEVVANIKGRDELLSFFGFSAALYLLSRYLLETVKAKWMLPLALLCFILALFSKESSVSYAIAIPLLLWMNPNVSKKQAFKTMALLLPLSLAFMLLREQIISNMPNPVDPGNFGLLNNPIAVEKSSSLKWGSTFALQALFLKKLFFPFDLIHDYSYNQIALVKMTSISAILGLAVLLGFGSYGLIGTLKRQYFALLGLLYLLFIVVAAQIIRPIGVHFAERLLFMAVLPFSIFLILALQHWGRQKIKNALKLQQRIFGFTLILCLIFSFKTIQRNGDWKSNFSLFEADIERASNSARANYNYGSELSAKANLTNNQLEKANLLQAAARHLKKAIDIYPEYLDAYNNLGIVYKRLENYQEAVKVYLKNIQIDPDYNKNYFNLATAYYELKQYENVIISMQEYVNREPNSADALFIMGQAAGHIKDFRRAIDYLNQAISINPKHINALNFLGMAYGMQGNHPAAAPIFQKALQLAPRRTDILMNLALSYRQQGKTQEEINTLQNILSIDPNHQVAKQQLGLLQ